MTFATPDWIHLFWFMAAIMIFLYLAFKRYKKRVASFAEPQLLTHIAKGRNRSYALRWHILLGLIFLFAILALMRPQWGFEWQEIKREGLDIIVVVDTSRSMLTQDVRPNRLERTKLAVQDLLKKLKGDRIGLVAFAGDAFMVCPLTVDYGGYTLSLNQIDTTTVPRGGTKLSRAIEEAMRGYDDTPSKFKAVIIVTDGDNLEGEPLEAAKKAKEKGIRIYTIGIGTPEGEIIQFKNKRGEMEFLKDAQGNFVKSRLNEVLLQEIAQAADGIYIRASGAQFGLEYIYDQELSQLEKRDIKSKREKKFYERFQIPLFIALIILLIHSTNILFIENEKTIS